MVIMEDFIMMTP